MIVKLHAQSLNSKQCLLTRARKPTPALTPMLYDSKRMTQSRAMPNIAGATHVYTAICRTYMSAWHAKMELAHNILQP